MAVLGKMSIANRVLISFQAGRKVGFLAGFIIGIYSERPKALSFDLLNRRFVGKIFEFQHPANGRRRYPVYAPAQAGCVKKTFCGTAGTSSMLASTPLTMWSVVPAGKTGCCMNEIDQANSLLRMAQGISRRLLVEHAGRVLVRQA